MHWSLAQLPNIVHHHLIKCECLVKFVVEFIAHVKYEHKFSTTEIVGKEMVVNLNEQGVEKVDNP